MTVYVDDMFRYPMGRYGRMKMSHMIADTEDELHEMAAAIGVARKWYQGDHYDVSMGCRLAAIRKGTIPITCRHLACMAALQKRGLPMGDPATAIERRLALSRAENPALAAALARRKAEA